MPAFSFASDEKTSLFGGAFIKIAAPFWFTRTVLLNLRLTMSENLERAPLCLRRSSLPAEKIFCPGGALIKLAAPFWFTRTVPLNQAHPAPVPFGGAFIKIAAPYIKVIVNGVCSVHVGSGEPSP